MKLALVLGVQSEKVKPRLQSIRDNLLIDCYKSVPSFIDASLKRELIYDRVLIISTLINDSTLEDLHKFWKKYSKGTDIVVICRSGSDNNLAKTILERFVSTSVTVMLVTSTTVQVMAEGVLLPIKQISERYGLKDYLSIETDDGFEFSAPEVKEKEEPTTEVEKPKEETKLPEKKKEKKSILGSLFGSKKKKHTEVKPQEPSVEIEPKEPSTEVKIQEPPTEVESKESLAEGVSENEESIHQEEKPEHEEVIAPIPEEEPITDIEDVSDDEFDFVEEQNSSENTPTTMEEVESLEEVEEVNDTPETIKEPSVDTEYECENTEYKEEKSDISVPNPVPTHVEEPKPIKNDFEPDMVDMDFGDTSVEVEDNTSQKEEFNFQHKEVSDDMFDDLADTEESYRNKEEQPIVIEKEVVKEIVRHVGKGTSTNLGGILSGKLHKTIIVTGDRGSGVTLTAYNIAKKFSEKVPVLYVDCDVERHGLLSYIDYDTFRSYEEIQKNSISSCRDTRSFQNCVCQFDCNLDILTTDYCYDTTDDAIEIMQTVIAENQMDYGVVVVDCPVSKLHLLPDLILTGNVILCTEGSKRGIMNMLCSMEGCPLSLRYKRSIVSRGTMFITKLPQKVKPENIISYGGMIFEADGCDWLDMTYKVFNGKLSKDIIETVVER